MTIRRVPLALVLLLAAAPSFAALDKYKDWEKSPEFVYLATDDEKKEWKKVASDEAADKFIALFWAKRHPNIETTPQNVFREQFEARVKLADERFALGTKKGALTERGRALILIGLPKSATNKAMAGSGPELGNPPGAMPGPQGAGGGTTIRVQWLYEKPQLPPWAELGSLEAKFEIDQTALVERLLDVSTVRRLEKKAAEVALVNPNRKDLPVYKTKEQVAAEQKAAADKAADESRGPALSEGARAMLEGLAKEPHGDLALLPLSYRDGATRLMVQVFAPGTAVGTGEGAKLLILARDKDGKDAVRLEEAAALRKTKSDFFTDRSFRIVPGDYDVAAALVDAAGKVLVSARRPVSVPGLPTEFAASPLLVSVNDFPSDAPKPDEPFTFSARRFVVKGDGRVDATDGLSYAVRLYNPPIDPVARTITLKRTVKIKPKGQPAIEVPTPPEEPAKVPEQKEPGAVVLDIAGGIVESNLGQYFKAGEYELRLTLTDVTTQKKLDLVAPFTVTGALPAAPPAAAVPKKKG